MTGGFSSTITVLRPERLPACMDSARFAQQMLVDGPLDGFEHLDMRREGLRYTVRLGEFLSAFSRRPDTTPASSTVMSFRCGIIA